VDTDLAAAAFFLVLRRDNKRWKKPSSRRGTFSTEISSTDVSKSQDPTVEPVAVQAVSVSTTGTAVVMAVSFVVVVVVIEVLLVVVMVEEVVVLVFEVMVLMVVVPSAKKNR